MFTPVFSGFSKALCDHVSGLLNVWMMDGVFFDFTVLIILLTFFLNNSKFSVRGNVRTNSVKDIDGNT